jgi:hypothetical protein
VTNGGSDGGGGARGLARLIDAEVDELVQFLSVAEIEFSCQRMLHIPDLHIKINISKLKPSELLVYRMLAEITSQMTLCAPRRVPHMVFPRHTPVNSGGCWLRVAFFFFLAGAPTPTLFFFGFWRGFYKFRSQYTIPLFSPIRCNQNKINIAGVHLTNPSS